VRARFFAPVQTGSGAHPAPCTMGTGSFPGVKWTGRGVDHPPPSSAEVEHQYSYTLYSPPVVYYRVTFTFYPLSVLFPNNYQNWRHSRCLKGCYALESWFVEGLAYQRKLSLRDEQKKENGSRVNSYKIFKNILYIFFNTIYGNIFNIDYISVQLRFVPTSKPQVQFTS
jgi:hypothetical protein